MEIAALEIVHAEAERLLERVSGRPAILGLCGSQGSGKSTLARALADRIDDTVVLSLDDLYLTLADREALAMNSDRRSAVSRCCCAAEPSSLR